MLQQKYDILLNMLIRSIFWVFDEKTDSTITSVRPKVSLAQKLETG